MATAQTARATRWGLGLDGGMIRSVLLGSLLVSAGVGLGMLLDSGRAQGALSTTAVAPVVAEHGEFTPLAVRAISGPVARFAGTDANLDANITAIIAEHGEFTPLAVRGTVVTSRFAGSDIGSN